MEDRSKRYEKLKMIGSGRFGKAWLVRSRQSRRSYVIKEIEVSGMTSEEMSQAVNEVAILSRLKHKNVVRYREAFTSVAALNIVMELADQGDLAQQIENRRQEVGRGFSEDQVLDWTVQICFALSYIHENKILHRDLKPANIFLTSSRVLKLGDFGIAKILKNTLDHAQTAIGTPYYLSPEICQRKPYNQKSDIWALGCVLYQLVTLRHPFQAKDFSNLVVNILSGIYPSLPSDYSLLVADLVSVLLRVTPEKRPTALQILGVPKLRAHVTKYTDRRNESVTSLPSSTVNTTVEGKQKVRPRLGGISSVTDVKKPHSKVVCEPRKMGNCKEEGSSVVRVKDPSDRPNSVSGKRTGSINGGIERQRSRVGKRKNSPVEEETSSNGIKSGPGVCVESRSRECNTNKRPPSANDVVRNSSSSGTSRTSAIKRPKLEGESGSEQQRTTSTKCIQNAKTSTYRLNSAENNLGGKVECKKSYILERSRSVPSVDARGVSTKQQKDNGTTTERSELLVVNEKPRHKGINNRNRGSMKNENEQQVASSTRTVVSSPSVDLPRTPDKTIEIAEVMHAGTPTGDDDTGSVRGRLESLREYLEEKLGTVKCVDAFECLEETTESRRLVKLMNERIGSSNMLYFPVLLQAWDLENRCH